MSLLEPLKRHPGGKPAESFRLMGEDLVLITWQDIAESIERYHQATQRLPQADRRALEDEQQAWALEAHRWLDRFNRSVHSRIGGYLELGARCQFAYPWPVVAVLGIQQVLGGMARSRVWGLIGNLAQLARYPRLEQLAEATDDILRRTNRGIFADSVPTVLYALRAAEHMQAGRRLGHLLIDGPPPPLLDDESMAVVRDLASGLLEVDRDRKFAALAKLTERHFAREQAVFSHHMRASRVGRPRPVRGWLRRMTAIPAVPAPRIARSRGQSRLVFESFRLSADFDIRDHDQRVEQFGQAFVRSITGSVDDYRIAVRHVINRFGRGMRSVDTAYD